jgi:hypothetical protein
MTLYDEEGLLPGFYPNCAIVPGSDDAFLVVSYLSEVPAWFLDTAASDERLKMFLSGSCPAVGAMLRSAEHFEASRGVASFPLLAVLSLDSNVSAPRPWGVVGGAVAGDTRWAPSMEAPFCAAMLDTIGLVGGAETEILGSSEELIGNIYGGEPKPVEGYLGSVCLWRRHSVEDSGHCPHFGIFVHGLIGSPGRQTRRMAYGRASLRIGNWRAILRFHPGGETPSAM